MRQRHHSLLAYLIMTVLSVAAAMNVAGCGKTEFTGVSPTFRSVSDVHRTGDTYLGVNANFAVGQPEQSHQPVPHPLATTEPATRPAIP